MFMSSIQFWAMMQVAVDLCLIVLFVVVIRQARSNHAGPDGGDMEKAADMMESVLKEAKEVAERFEIQLRDKQEIIKRLNDRLDSRVIGLNLLLSRAEAQTQRLHKDPGDGETPRDVYRLQQEIISLAGKGVGAGRVAQQLGVAKGEVEMVIDLKKKFEAMEKA